MRGVWSQPRCSLVNWEARSRYRQPWDGGRKSPRRTSAEKCGAFADIAQQRPNTAEMIFFMNRFHSLGDGSVTPQCGRSTPALRSDSDVAAFRVGLLH